MNRRDLMLGFIFLVGFPAAAVMGSCIGQSVGGRGQDSNTSGSTREWRPPVEGVVLPVDSSSALVPAPSDRAVGDEVAVPLEEIQAMLPVLAAPPVEPASTVTQSALTNDQLPDQKRANTPVATSRAVETLAPKSINSYDPWPPALWPVVECLIERESKGDPYAVGLAGERGLMQVHPITWGYLARYGITPDELFDPATNIRAAYLLYIEAGGLRPWGGGCA